MSTATLHLLPAPVAEDTAPVRRPRRHWLTSDRPAWWPSSRTRLRLMVLEDEARRSAVKADAVFSALADICGYAGIAVPEQPAERHERHLQLVSDQGGAA
jgi:hypothetical protein